MLHHKHKHRKLHFFWDEAHPEGFLMIRMKSLFALFCGFIQVFFGQGVCHNQESSGPKMCFAHDVCYCTTAPPTLSNELYSTFSSCSTILESQTLFLSSLIDIRTMNPSARYVFAPGLTVLATAGDLSLFFAAMAANYTHLNVDQIYVLQKNDAWEISVNMRSVIEKLLAAPRTQFLELLLVAQPTEPVLESSAPSCVCMEQATWLRDDRFVTADEKVSWLQQKRTKQIARAVLAEFAPSGIDLMPHGSACSVDQGTTAVFSWTSKTLVFSRYINAVLAAARLPLVSCSGRDSIVSNLGATENSNTINVTLASRAGLVVIPNTPFLSLIDLVGLLYIQSAAMILHLHGPRATRDSWMQANVASLFMTSEQLVWLPVQHNSSASAMETKWIPILERALAQQVKLCDNLWPATAPRRANLQDHPKFCSSWMTGDGSQSGLRRHPPFCNDSLLCLPVLSCPATHELLHNGICLPNPWPPHYSLLKYANFSPDPPYVKWKPPQTPPYFTEGSSVPIPVHVNRQLFVDDFLIDQFCSRDIKRKWHNPTISHIQPSNLDGFKHSELIWGSAVHDPVTRQTHLYMLRRFFPGAGGDKPSNLAVRYSSKHATGSKRFHFNGSLSQVLIDEATGTPLRPNMFSVSFRKVENRSCPFVLAHGSPPVLSLWCSNDGLRFQKVNSGVPNGMTDGVSFAWDRFRRKYSIVFRDNVLGIVRILRYIDFNPIQLATYKHDPFLGCRRRFPSRPHFNPVRDARSHDVLAAYSSCQTSSRLNEPRYFLTPTADDPKYNAGWDVDIHGIDQNIRLTDAYAANLFTYESAYMALRLLHTAGRHVPKKLYPTLLFSRDGFHYVDAGPTPGSSFIDPSDGMLINNLKNASSHNPGFMNCIPLPDVLNCPHSEAINQPEFSYFFCSGSTKSPLTTINYWNAIYEIKKDGFAAIRPKTNARADLWTKWLSVPRFHALYLNLELSDQQSEIFPCIFFQNNKEELCFKSVLGPLKSTAYKFSNSISSTQRSMEEDSYVSFRLRIRIYGNASVYSFWFSSTTFLDCMSN